MPVYRPPMWEVLALEVIDGLRAIPSDLDPRLLAGGELLRLERALREVVDALLILPMPKPVPGRVVA